MLKLYLIYQQHSNEYDTYDSAVVCAYDKSDAKTIHPAGGDRVCVSDPQLSEYASWPSIEYVQVRYLGKAGIDVKRGVICASFNAG